MMSSPVPKPFPLLKLPPEIRNCIWKYVVVKDGCIIFREYMIYAKSPATGLRSGDPAKIYHKADEPRQTSLLAVAFTCRQLYQEVTPIYYGENIFRPDWYSYMLGSCQMFQNFTDAIGPTNAGTISQINLCQFFWFYVGDYLALLPNLKRVHFDRPPASQGDTKMTFAKKYKWLEVVYGGEV